MSPGRERRLAGAFERLRRHPAAELEAVVAGVFHRDPDALQHEPGDRDRQQADDEDPVPDPVGAAAVFLRLAGSVGPAVVQLCRTQHRSPHHHHQQPGDEHRPEEIEDGLEAEVEVADVERLAEDRLDDVMGEGDHDGAHGEDDPAVEDAAVSPSGEGVAARDR